MGNKKYILTDEVIEFEGRKLYRIKALRNFGRAEIGGNGTVCGQS